MTQSETESLKADQTPEAKKQLQPTPIRPIIYLAYGLVAGILIAGAAMVVTAPRMMMETHLSRFGFEETVAKLEAAVAEGDWEHQGTTYMHEGLAKRGQPITCRTAVISLCNPIYAQSVLCDSPNMACMMPCKIAVLEMPDSSVRITKMNTGLMGKMFGGKVGEVMGDRVGPEEHQMLKDVIK